MKRFYNFIAKHNEGLLLLAMFSLFIVADAEPRMIFAWIPVPLILIGMSALGRRIKNEREDEESL